MELYKPREDSHLLEKYVKQLAKGLTLDIGTGSGIQARAAKKASFVIAVDINQEALEYCNKHIKSEKTLVLKSDLFEFFNKKFVEIDNGDFKGFSDIKDQKNSFDTIIFNPPYLPNEEKDKDIALDGGVEGFELIERFLKQAKEFLAKDGIILLVFSSLTKKDKVDEILKENNYDFEELEKIHVFFEDIYCYKIKNVN